MPDTTKAASALQRNYLQLPDHPTFQEKLDHALASLFLSPEAFPIYPDAEKSYHPVWKDHEEVARRTWAERDGEDISGYRITKVFSVKTADWMEFLDTEAGNSEHDGLVAEVERTDGWTGRYCLEITLADAIATLQASFAA